jgi:uncharacterized protein YidB (DUF937 family)
MITMGLFDNLAALAGGIDPSRHPAGIKVMAFIDAQPGGLNGLVARFHEHGLGAIVDSWVGTGENLPVSAEQIESVLGPEGIGKLAGKIGLPAGMVAALAARFLPQLIDQATPHGLPPQP